MTRNELREKAAAFAEEALRPEGDDCWGELQELDYDREFQTLQAAYMCGHDDGYNADRWINVHDRMPQDNKEVLGFFEFGIDIGILVPQSFGWIIIDKLGGYTATHWQPLPSPPIK